MDLSLKTNISKPLLFIALLTIGLTAQAQTTQSTLPHTLLWRISGKGLQQPSYLYGTIHLNDKRLFRFDDSVYRAIEKTEGLAIEVNPDEMAAYFVNQLFDQLESGKKLQDVLDKKYFNSHKKELEKKFKKHAEDISATEVVKEKNKWMQEYLEKGEMPTFMDAYLYNIARRQGKWLGGIEDLNDQTGLMADLVDQSDVNYLLATDTSERRSDNNKSIEEMIGFYLAQDLEGIEGFTNGHSTAETKDLVLIRRNIKMARRIDSLASLRTMFLAIGAAHLPGDSGVISLLRARGFTLTPVFSDKKIAAADYTFKEVRVPWVSVTDDEENYTVEMPANPGKVKLYGMIEMKFLMDLFNLTGFCTSAIINASHNSNKDSLFKMTASRMFHDGKVPAAKDLVKNGVVGKEYIHIAKGENMRVQIFADERMVYLALLSSLKGEMLTSPDADKFFQSFTLHPKKEQTTQVVETFTDSIMGVSFTAPAKLTYNEKFSSKKDDAWKITSFTGIDPSAGTYIMLFSKELKPGYHIPDENVIHENFYKTMRNQYSDVTKDSSYLDNAKMIKIYGKNSQRSDIFATAVSIVKGSRQIILMVISDSLTIRTPVIQSAFTSFHFITHPSVNWQTYRSPDSTFTVYGPSPLRTHFYAEGNTIEWVSYDTTTATSYLIIPDTIGKYKWYTSDSVFWRSRLGSDTAKEDLVEIKDVTNGDLQGKEFFNRHPKASILYFRTRMMVSGDKVYKLFVSGEKDLVYSAAVDRFFKDFRINGGVPGTATQSKASLLLHDLGSKDSATRYEAYIALQSARFGKGDLPLLKEALFKPYLSPYDTTPQTYINVSIANNIADLNDPSIVGFVRETYPSLIREKRTLQNTALSLLAHQHSTDSYALLAELLRQGPTSEKLNYAVLYELKDSLSLTVTLFPALQTWVTDTLQAPSVAYIFLQLLDSNYLTKTSIMASGEAFIRSAAALLPGLKVNEDYDDYNFSSLITLIGRLHTPSAYALLKSYLSIKNKHLLQVVVKQLVEAAQPVPAAVLHRLAADPVFRTGLYSNLKEHKKTALFPAEYLTQARFAESSIYDANDEDDGTIDKVTFLSKKTAVFHGRSYVWYLYKVRIDVDGDFRNCLGIAGGYDPVGAPLQPKKDASGIYWGKDFDGEKVGAMLKDYLKERDEED